jgi:hypothetical protein
VISYSKNLFAAARGDDVHSELYIQTVASLKMDQLLIPRRIFDAPEGSGSALVLPLRTGEQDECDEVLDMVKLDPLGEYRHGLLQDVLALIVGNDPEMREL